MFGEERKKTETYYIGMSQRPLEHSSQHLILAWVVIHVRVAKWNRFFINLIKDKWGRDSGLNLLHSNFYGVIIITPKMAKKF